MALQLQPDDLQALGLFGQPQPQDYGGLPSSVDQLLQVQPLQFNPGPAPSVGAPPATPPASSSEDKIAGRPDLLGHLQTVMKAAAAGQLQTGAPKGLVKAGETVKTTDDGLTPEQRASGVAAAGQAELDTKQVMADRQEQIATQAAAHAAKLRAEAAVEEEQRKKQEQEQEEKAQRIRDHQEALAEQRDEPVNPNRYFENMSAFGKAAAIISAFSYGFLNPRNQGTAPVVQTLMQMANEDTRAQIANNQEGRARRGDLIALYERRYGDVTLVQKKLEADKLMTLSKKALAEAEDSKSAEAKAAAQDLAKNIAIQAALKNKQVEQAYAAKPVREITDTYKPAGGKGGGLDAMKKAIELDALLEKQAYPREQRAAMLKAAGLPPPEGHLLTAAEQTNKEQSDAAALKAKAAADKFEQLSPEEKKDARVKIDGLADVVDTLDSMAEAGGIQRGTDGKFTHEGSKLKNLTGPGQIVQDASQHAPLHLGEGIAQGLAAASPKEANDLRRNRDTIAAGLAKAEFARTTEFEFNNEQARLPMGNPTDFVSGMNYAESKAQAHYRNAVGQYGQERVDRELRERGVDPDRFKAAKAIPTDAETKRMVEEDMANAYNRKRR